MYKFENIEFDIDQNKWSGVYVYCHQFQPKRGAQTLL